MKKIIFFIAFSLVGMSSYTDSECMVDCLSNGHVYGYCKAICSY